MGKGTDTACLKCGHPIKKPTEKEYDVKVACPSCGTEHRLRLIPMRKSELLDTLHRLDDKFRNDNDYVLLSGPIVKFGGGSSGRSRKRSKKKPSGIMGWQGYYQ
jgi:predicted RNA-binding Zn-ribbon protein involved in translation (DUF1610 family)